MDVCLSPSTRAWWYIDNHQLYVYIFPFQFFFPFFSSRPISLSIYSSTRTFGACMSQYFIQLTWLQSKRVNKHEMKCSVLLLFEVECGGLEREKKNENKYVAALGWTVDIHFFFQLPPSLFLSACLWWVLKTQFESDSYSLIIPLRWARVVYLFEVRVIEPPKAMQRGFSIHQFSLPSKCDTSGVCTSPSDLRCDVRRWFSVFCFRSFE